MPAVVSKISPGQGRAGDVLTITGSGFSPTFGRNVVAIGGIAAGVNTNGATELQVVAPAGMAVDQHLPVVVENLDDPGQVTWYWWSLDTGANTGAMVLRTKVPWHDEVARGLGRTIKNMNTAEARFFERVASKVELVPDMLNAKGDFFSRAGDALGMRRAPAGIAGQPFVSAVDTTGGQFQARQCQTLRWGRLITSATLTSTMEVGAVDGLSTSVATHEVVMDAGQLALLSVRERSSASSRVNRIEVLFNDVVVLDLQNGDPDFPGPGLRNGQSLTIYPGLRVAQGDRVQVRVSRNNTTTPCSVLAYGLVV